MYPVNSNVQACPYSCLKKVIVGSFHVTIPQPQDFKEMWKKCHQKDEP